MSTDGTEGRDDRSEDDGADEPRADDHPGDQAGGRASGGSSDGEPESGGRRTDGRESGRTVTTRAPGDDVVHPSSVDREFGWRGYVLLAVLVLALVIAPVVVALRPPALSWEVRLVVFPLLPALLLGVVAVWATTRP